MGRYSVSSMVNIYQMLNLALVYIGGGKAKEKGGNCPSKFFKITILLLKLFLNIINICKLVKFALLFFKIYCY